jgi:hypothetical protein
MYETKSTSEQAFLLGYTSKLKTYTENSESPHENKQKGNSASITKL